MRWRRRSNEAEQASQAGEERPAERTVEADRGGRAESRMGEPRDRARPRGFRVREAGAATVGALGSGIVSIARLVRTIAVLIAILIALAIVLRDVGANSGNTIVEGVHEGANFFAGAFTGLIQFSGHPKRAITVNWGIALIAYLIVGAVVANLIGRLGQGGLGFGRRHRPLHTP